MVLVCVRATSLLSNKMGEAAAAILSEGFRDGERGSPWFALDLRAFGERARGVLPETSLDASDEELKSWAREGQDEEIWDSDVDDFVPITDPQQIERFVWYEIPVEIVNSRGNSRCVPADERRRLFLYGPDRDELPDDH